jgi:hypothetical protein
MPDTHETHAARLEQIQLELARQNEMLATIAPEMARSAPARSLGAQRSLAHLNMRRA